MDMEESMLVRGKGGEKMEEEEESLRWVLACECSLQNLRSHWIVRKYICPWQPAKQTTKKAAGEGFRRRLSDAQVRISHLFQIRSLFGFESPSLISCHDLLLSERKGIHFSWKVDNSLPNRKGKVVHISHVETGSSF